jgi:hypothetical protein
LQAPPQEAAQPTDPNEVLGVFESGGFTKGMPAGYRFVVRRSMVIGKKEYLGTNNYFAYLPVKLTEEKDKERAMKKVQQIEEKQDFQLSPSQTIGIEFKAPGTFSGGHLAFRTTDKGEVEFKVSSMAGGDVVKNLLRALQEFAPGKVTIQGK